MRNLQKYFESNKIIINKVISLVKEDVIAENKMNYTILMILIDGIIDDMDETIDSLVEASFFPIFVIIIKKTHKSYSS